MKKKSIFNLLSYIYTGLRNACSSDRLQCKVYVNVFIASVFKTPGLVRHYTGFYDNFWALHTKHGADEHALKAKPVEIWPVREFGSDVWVAFLLIHKSANCFINNLIMEDKIIVVGCAQVELYYIKSFTHQNRAVKVSSNRRWSCASTQ